MSRAPRALTFRIALAVAFLATGTLFAAEGPEPLVPWQADADELQRALDESRVETSPSRPGLTLYLQDAAVAVGRWVAGFFERLVPGLSSLAEWFLRVSTVLLYGLLGLVVLILLTRLALRWWRDRQVHQAFVLDEPQPFPSAERPTLDHWEAEVRRRLDERQLVAALEAVWWWLASALEPAAVDASWTSRELIARAGRGDLGPQVRRLDRMIYGPRSPAAEEVRDLFRDLREAVA